MNTTPTPSPGSDPTRTRWRTRTKLLVASGLTVTVAGGLMALDVATNETHHTSRRYNGTINVLDIDMSAGSVKVVGSDDPVTTVEVTTHGGLREAPHSETIFGDHLRLHSDCGLRGFLSPTCEVDYVIRVPAHVSVVAEADGTRLNLLGTTGDVDVSVNGGNVDMEFAAAPGTIKADTNGGAVKIRVPDDANRYRVETATNGGSTKVAIRTDPESDHLIDVETNGGSINVGYLADPVTQ